MPFNYKCTTSSGLKVHVMGKHPAKNNREEEGKKEDEKKKKESEKMKEESKESSDGAASPLEEEEFENKEEKKKEKTEESSESVPTSPLDHNWGKGLPSPTQVVAAPFTPMWRPW